MPGASVISLSGGGVRGPLFIANGPHTRGNSLAENILAENVEAEFCSAVFTDRGKTGTFRKSGQVARK